MMVESVAVVLSSSTLVWATAEAARNAQAPHRSAIGFVYRLLEGDAREVNTKKDVNIT